MNKLLVIGAAAGVALALSACASQPHSAATMLAGSHSMPPKGTAMSDRSMPSWSGDRTKQALEKMPPEHREICEKAKSHNP